MLVDRWYLAHEVLLALAMGDLRRGPAGAAR